MNGVCTNEKIREFTTSAGNLVKRSDTKSIINVIIPQEVV